MNSKAIVLHSGGLDSTVCLLKAIKDNREVISLGIDYGQRHRLELEYADHQCRKFQISRRVVRVEWDKPSRSFPEGRTVDEIRTGVSPAFLPGRNAVFLTIACAEACGLGASEVWIGINSIDYSGYPDCRPDFIKAFQTAIDFAIPDGPRIITPLLTLTKPQIAAEATALELTRGETWSCYKPEILSNGVQPCGKCDACILNEYAWKHVATLNQKH